MLFHAKYNAELCWNLRLFIMPESDSKISSASNVNESKEEEDLGAVDSLEVICRTKMNQKFFHQPKTLVKIMLTNASSKR